MEIANGQLLFCFDFLARRFRLFHFPCFSHLMAGQMMLRLNVDTIASFTTEWHREQQAQSRELGDLAGAELHARAASRPFDHMHEFMGVFNRISLYQLCIPSRPLAGNQKTVSSFFGRRGLDRA